LIHQRLFGAEAHSGAASTLRHGSCVPGSRQQFELTARLAFNQNLGDKTMTPTIRIGRVALALSCSLAATHLHAQDSPWMVRGRALLIVPDHDSSPVGALAVPSDAIQVQKRWIPELDITYFVSRNLATELVLGYTKLDVNVTSSAAGAFDAGSFHILPPTLTLQWHFAPDAAIRPYVGAGINYTRFGKVRLAVPTAPAIALSLEKDSFGPAVQAGVDIQLDRQWFLNLDLKKVQIRTEVRGPTGAELSIVRADPWLFGVGVGYKF
jgi:outer membrane protein